MTDNALYLEVDEDITSAIDKLTKSAGQQVQIVVPKRSTMLQSMINLKLLKKAADDAHKQLVLVTNDRIAVDLAGRVGLAVAPSIGAKAKITEQEMPESLGATEEIIDDSDPEPPKTPEPEPKPKSKKPPVMKRRELSDEPVAEPAALEADTSDDSTTTDAQPKKKVKVPNWNKLQTRAIWVVLVLALIVAYPVVMFFYTDAKVTIYANGTNTSVAMDFTADPTASSSSIQNNVLAAKQISATKSLSGSFTATGQQDIGTKATGTMTVSNTYDSNPHSFVSGTRFVDASGNTFVATAAFTVTGATVAGGGIQAGTGTVAVTADQNGSQYNDGPGSYTMPGLSAGEQAGFTAKGGQMSGGTSNIITIVAQSDVDNEQASLLAGDKNNAGSDLQPQIPSGYVAIPASVSSSTASVTPSPSVGAQATNASLSLKVTYTELVVKTSDYKAMLDASDQSQIGNANQIYDDGYSGIEVSQSSANPDGAQTYHLTTVVANGPKLDTTSIAKAIAGKKYGDASNYIQGLAGVANAQISLWPSWSGSLPSRADKIHIVIKVANNTSS